MAFNEDGEEAFHVGDAGKAAGTSRSNAVISAALAAQSVPALDAEIARRIAGELKFYDGVSHMGVFGVPKEVRLGLDAEERVMTRDNPIFMY